jgi:hypothetical protein
MYDEAAFQHDHLIAEAYNADLGNEFETIDVNVTDNVRYLCARNLFKDLGFSREAIHTLTHVFKTTAGVEVAIADAVLNEVLLRLLKDKIKESESEFIEGEGGICSI